MQTALIDGQRTAPHPWLDAAGATCPACGAPVVAKCGEIVAWHFAHQAAEDCGAWAEPDTDWHPAWQQKVPLDRREVVRGPHRVDIVTPAGRVVELQHSALGPAEIREREDFYGDMIWLFDATDAYAAGRIELRAQSYGVSFRWKHPRKSLAACRRAVLLDLGGDQILTVRRIHTAAPCGGWGHLTTTTDFIDHLNGRD